MVKVLEDEEVSWIMPTLSHQVCLVFALNLQMLITGYGVGFSAPCLTQLSSTVSSLPSTFPAWPLVLTEDELQWFPGSLVLGQVLGIALGPLLADRVGRRVTCLLASLSSLGSWIILSTAQAGWVLLLSRTLTGFTDSLVLPAGIMYISEISEPKYRGTFVNTTGLAYGLGIAVAYLVGGATSWRVAGLLPPVLSCVVIPVLAIMKESPAFLLSKQREALGALQWYRREGSEQERALIVYELHDLESSLEGKKLTAMETVRKLLNRDNRKPYFILLVLFALHPLTGVYSITFFALDLFETLGLGSVEAVAVSSALVRVLGTALSSVLMHRFGRRPLYIPSSAMATLAMAAIGSLLLVREANVSLPISASTTSWMMVSFIFIFMFSFGVAIAGFPWVLMGEWFSPDLMSLVTGTLITVQFAFIFVAVQITNVLLSLLGAGGLFLYFCLVCAVNTVFVVLVVPETQGQTYAKFQALRQLETDL